jgi:hypothetical protein
MYSPTEANDINRVDLELLGKLLLKQIANCGGAVASGNVLLRDPLCMRKVYSTAKRQSTGRVTIL